VARCGDWPIVAVGARAGDQVVTVRSEVVVAATPAARERGVVEGVRRREAQARCPGVEVLEYDDALVARRWEPIVAVLDGLTPRVEVPGPGRVAFATRGPSRYFGGDEALAHKVLELLNNAVIDRDGPLGQYSSPVGVGVADGFFAAAIAAGHSCREGNAVLVDAGASSTFLGPQPLGLLDHDDLVSVLGRLGLQTLGDFAQLPVGDIVARFGQSGLRAHRLASGLDPRVADARRIPEDLTAASEIDPPAQRLDQVAFLGKVLADQLHRGLDQAGLACTRVLIEIESEHGERRGRLWRHEGALSAGALADRVRWQIDGWLNGDVVHRPTAGITLLRLVPDQVVAATGSQLGFWSDRRVAPDAVTRVLARVQGLLGPDAVMVPEYRGGRDPASAAVAVSAAGVDLGEERPAASADWVEAPWPGKLPPPSPVLVASPSTPMWLIDHHGQEVEVNGRGEISAAPCHLLASRPGPDDRHDASAPSRVESWAGPWPVDERWWSDRDRRARLQVLTADGVAHLLSRVHRRWWLNARYD
jgi:protein ImuB